MSTLKSNIMPYIQLMRLDRPIGILLLMWPTLWALWMAAKGFPDPTVLIVFVLGVIIMRSAGCAINDFADRHVDGRVWRTQGRPLATGDLDAKDAVLLFAVLAIVAFLLVLTLNALTIRLSVIGVVLAATYPFMKRYTYLPQLYLGLAFGWAIPMAFAAQTNSLPAIAWLLLLANIIWATVYDTFYAMADREDDLLAGIKSTAILFGDDDRTILGILQVTFVIVMILIGMQLHLGWIYYLSLLIASLLFVYQQIITRSREPAQCLLAFLNNNWVGAVIFVGLVMDYSFLQP